MKIVFSPDTKKSKKKRGFFEKRLEKS